MLVGIVAHVNDDRVVEHRAIAFRRLVEFAGHCGDLFHDENEPNSNHQMNWRIRFAQFINSEECQLSVEYPVLLVLFLD